MARQPLVCQDLLIIEASRSHSDTPHSVGLLWTSDRSVVKNLYLTKHNTHNRQTSMLPAGFEPAIPASERPQTHDLHCEATGKECSYSYIYSWFGRIILYPLYQHRNSFLYPLGRSSSERMWTLWGRLQIPLTVRHFCFSFMRVLCWLLKRLPASRRAGLVRRSLAIAYRQACTSIWHFFHIWCNGYTAVARSPYTRQ
jgi:hypothetical protein